MKHTLLTAICCFYWVFGGFSHNPPDTVQAQFPGGNGALYQFLAEKITYPQQALDEGIEGVVQVEFMVDADGTIAYPQVVQGIGGGCDEEALRVIKLLPKWNPAKIDGLRVPQRYTLPVKFAIEGTGKKKRKKRKRRRKKKD